MLQIMAIPGITDLAAFAQRPFFRSVARRLFSREAAWATMASALVPSTALWTRAIDLTPLSAIVGFLVSSTLGVIGAAMLLRVEWAERRGRRSGRRQ